MKIRPKTIFVTSNFTLKECIPSNIYDAIEARFNMYEFDKDNGVKVQKRIDKDAPDRVFKVLKQNEQHLFPDNGLLEEASISTLSAEAAAFGTPEISCEKENEPFLSPAFFKTQNES